MSSSKSSMPSSNGQLLRRQTACSSKISNISWESCAAFGRPQTPKSPGGKNHACSWNVSMICVLTGAVVLVLHLFAAFAFPLSKDGLCGGYRNIFRSPASSFAARDQTAEATTADVISVSTSSGSLPTSKDSIINLDHGDPTMYEKFWQENGYAAELVIPGYQTMSYFSDVTNLCWFLEPVFATQIRRIHHVVGNAIAADERFIIVGTGSSQLFQATLFALSTSPEVSAAAAGRPVPVVSSVPYYSSYPAATDLLQSGLFRWAGDAGGYKNDRGPYIEVVCSPSNPDGLIKTASVGSGNGKVIHDLAYYWPQYTAITASADHDIMLFTVSKCTGHAGTRLGWALVKDREVAKRMMKFIEVSTIGVSKDAQLRAAKILKTVSDRYETEAAEEFTKFFHFGRKTMRDRWQRLQEAVATTGVFSLPVFQPEYCNFMKEITLPYPAFAWLKCGLDIEDCENFLRQRQNILTRSGKHFGADTNYVRVSMLDREKTFDMFIERLSSVQLEN